MSSELLSWIQRKGELCIIMFAYVHQLAQSFSKSGFHTVEKDETKIVPCMLTYKGQDLRWLSNILH